MDEKIVAKVKLEPNNPQVIVRKVTLREDGKVEKKEGLSKEGNWIEVPEATIYPDECYLPVEIW